MSSNASLNTNQTSPAPGNSAQPVIYGVVSETQHDEIKLGELFSRLFTHWKLIFGITIVGTILAAIFALTLPKVYQPTLKVSVPLAGNVSSISTINVLLGGKEENLPSTPQAVFTHYFDLLRSEKMLEEYVQEKGYLQKLYPDINEQNINLRMASLIRGLNVEIEEPTPKKKGAYIANPERVKISLNIKDEIIGVELLNNFSKYVNQRLILNLQDDAREIIKNKIDILSQQVGTEREKYKQQRLLTIKKMEQNNAEKIAQIKEHITATLKKAEANRKTEIANAKESLEIAKSLNITNPTTVEALAQREQKGQGANAAITLVDNKSSSLYLLGTKYLTTLIETLEQRKSDEVYLTDINTLREEIHLIKNDQALKSLKSRTSDDPWIKKLPEKNAEIEALKQLNPDFANLVAYDLDESALITGQVIKPRMQLMVALGFLLSLILAILLALILASIKRK